MKAVLQAEVELWNVAAFAEVALWETRPELRLLCGSAAKSGALTDAVVLAALPGLTERGRKNLVRHLEYMQLVDGSGALTALGRRCAQTGEAPAWEQGAYHLLVARHPLFGARVLDFQRAPGDGQDRDFNGLEPLPTWLAAERDRVVTSALDANRRFSIAAFPAPRGQDPACRTRELEPAKLSWEIDLLTGANKWAVAGNVGPPENQMPFATPPDSVEPKELVALYASWEKRWDPRQSRVLMPFDGRLGPGGREGFTRSWRYKGVKVGRYGTFDEVVVHDVPVGPGTDADARTWATAMLVGRVEAAGRYLSPSEFAGEWADVVGSPPLAGRGIDAPEPSSLREVNGKAVPARTRWLVTAPADLLVEA